MSAPKPWGWKDRAYLVLLIAAWVLAAWLLTALVQVVQAKADPLEAYCRPRPKLEQVRQSWVGFRLEWGPGWRFAALAGRRPLWAAGPNAKGVCR